MKKIDNKEINEILRCIKTVVRKKKIGLHEPIIGNLEKNEINKCIESGYISTSGNYHTKQFEKKIKSIVKSNHVIATINGTSAIHIALKIIGVEENNEVLIPSFNFIAAANAVLYCRAIPHFIDIEKDNIFIDPNKLETYLKNNFIKKKKSYNQQKN